MERRHASAGRLRGTTAGDILHLRLLWLGLLVGLQSMHMCCAVRTHDHSDVMHLVACDFAGDLTGGTAALQYQVEAPLSKGCG